MERSVLEMLSDRSSAPTLLGCRPSARKSLGRSQKRFQLLTQSSFSFLHHDNNHSFKANSLLNLSCPRRYEGSGPDWGVVARGLDRVFRCCTQGPWFPGAGVKDIWEDHVPDARGLCRETHEVEVVGVLSACSILTPDLWPSTRDVSSVALHSVSQAARGSVSPLPPAPAAPNAARTCPQIAYFVEICRFVSKDKRKPSESQKAIISWRCSLDLLWKLSTAVQHCLYKTEISKLDDDYVSQCFHAWDSCPQSCRTPWTPKTEKKSVTFQD